MPGELRHLPVIQRVAGGPLLELPALEAMLVFRHIDALAAEADTLHFEARTLLQGGLPR